MPLLPEMIVKSSCEASTTEYALCRMDMKSISSYRGLFLLSDKTNAAPANRLRQQLLLRLFAESKHLITYALCALFSIENNALVLLIRGAICLTVPNLIWIGLYHKDNAFRYVLSVVTNNRG